MSYYANHPQLGVIDLNAVDVLAPGPGNLVGDYIDSGRWPQLGSIVTGYDTTYGGATFIYLKCAASTAIAKGTIVYWDKTYTATACPAVSTSKKSGRALAVAQIAIASSSSVQYAWFMIQGKTTVLKTAVQVTLDQPLYISTSAGRFYLTASAGAQILGARTVNTTTVTTTTSSVLCVLNNPTLQGYS